MRWIEPVENWPAGKTQQTVQTMAARDQAQKGNLLVGIEREAAVSGPPR